MPSSQQAQIQAEVIQLHEFFVDWFNATCVQTDEYYHANFESRFVDEFEIIMPSGQLFTTEMLFSQLREVYGSSTQFKIQIRNVQTRDVSSDLIVTTYEEWQKNALNSEPADNGRISSGLLKKDDAAPNGVRWLHLHETWLPADIIQADPFDF